MRLEMLIGRSEFDLIGFGNAIPRVDAFAMAISPVVAAHVLGTQKFATHTIVDISDSR